MSALRVSGHAISRYRQRVEPVGYDEAVARLSSPAILAAAHIGATSVKLPGGHRVIIENRTVVTVYPKPTVSRRRWGRRFAENED